MYRLENFIGVSNALPDFPDLVHPLRDLGSCLAGCIFGAPELQEEVNSLLEERNQQVQWERETDLKCRRRGGDVLFVS
jgi:hypothetical protein